MCGITVAPIIPIAIYNPSLFGIVGIKPLKSSFASGLAKIISAIKAKPMVAIKARMKASIFRMPCFWSTSINTIKANKFTDDFIGTYTKEWFELRGNQLKTRLKARHLLEQLTDDDFNYLAESLNMDEALKIGNGTLTKAEMAILFTKKLIKRPGLVKIMMKYLSEGTSEARF